MNPIEMRINRQPKQNEINCVIKERKTGTLNQESNLIGMRKAWNLI